MADVDRDLLLRMHSLPKLANAAYEAGQFEEARNYASELLEKGSSGDLPEFFRNDGNAIHYGHLMLGRVALKIGDLEQAKQHLEAARRTPRPDVQGEETHARPPGMHVELEPARCRRQGQEGELLA